MIQAAVAEFAPEQAAKWRCDAGGGLSVQTLAEMQSGQPLTAAAQQDLWNHDAEFVGEFQQQRDNSLEEQLKALEKGAAEKRLQNILHQTAGDEIAAKRRIEAEGAETQRLSEQRAVWTQGVGSDG